MKRTIPLVQLLSLMLGCLLGLLLLLTDTPKSSAQANARKPSAEAGPWLDDKTAERILAAWKEHEAKRTDKSLKSLLETVWSAAHDENLDGMAHKIWLDYYNSIVALTKQPKPQQSSPPKGDQPVPSVPLPPRTESSPLEGSAEPWAGLGGLHGIFVTVEKPKPEIERLGLSGNSIHDEVQVRLRAAGIPVLTKEEFHESENCPMLVVSLQVFPLDSGPSLLYSITVSARELAYVLRRPVARAAVVTTWTSDSVPAMTPNANIRDIRETLCDQVDQFISAYQAANPKTAK